MESNIGFSTTTSSGNPVHSALSSEPFLANSNNSSVNQNTSFRVANSNPSRRFHQNQRFSDPSASATLGSASYQNPISMSTCFQKSVPKLQATKICLDEVVRHFSGHNNFFAYVIIRKMIYHQSLLNGESKHLIDGYGCNDSLDIPALNRLEKHFETQLG